MSGVVYKQERYIQAKMRDIQELTNHRPVANELERAKVDIANQNKEANTGHLKQCPLFLFLLLTRLNKKNSNSTFWCNNSFVMSSIAL